MLGVLEAMKMELALTAPVAGTVTTVGAAVGEQVALGATLFVVEARPSGEDGADEVDRQVVPDPDLPERVTIYEVGPRDGLQNEQTRRPGRGQGGVRASGCVDAGLPVVEATSFVHPRWVPQLADAEELLDLLGGRLGDRARDLPVLVPNERGLDRALELGLPGTSRSSAAPPRPSRGAT